MGSCRAEPEGLRSPFPIRRSVGNGREGTAKTVRSCMLRSLSHCWSLQCKVREDPRGRCHSSYQPPSLLGASAKRAQRASVAQLARRVREVSVLWVSSGSVDCCLCRCRLLGRHTCSGKVGVFRLFGPQSITQRLM